jgi:hypothetical protein
VARTVSGSISLPYPGFFSPFPHGTGCAIGDRSCLALSSGLDGFTRGSTCSVLLGYRLNRSGLCPYGALTHYGATFQPLPLDPQPYPFLPASKQTAPTPKGGIAWFETLRWEWRPHNPKRRIVWFRLVRVRSPLLAESLRFLFLRLLRCFSSPGSLLNPYVFRKGFLDMTPRGFPHSGIPGSTLLCSSPGRFAAYAPFFGNLSLGIHRTASLIKERSSSQRSARCASGQPLCDFQRTLTTLLGFVGLALASPCRLDD